MNVFIVSITNEHERKKNMRIRNGFEEFFCLRSKLSNDKKLSALRPGLKTGVENYIFWSEVGSGFGEPGCTPPPRIPWPEYTPPPGKYPNSHHPPNKAIKLDWQKDVFKHPGKRCFNFLPDYMTNFPLHPF